MPSGFEVTKLRCEYAIDPLGIDVVQPRLSWLINADRRGARQTAYQIVVTEVAFGNESGEVLWDSGKVPSDKTTHIVYQGTQLRSTLKVEWKVRAWDEKDQASEWSKAATWEMGLFDQSDWKAKWIGAGLVGGPRTTIPCPFLRKDFVLAKGEITRARLYATALGLYEITINGKRVGDDELNPGWTDFRKRVRYRAYDVKDLLNPGANAIGAILGDGWYCGNLETRGRQFYGDRPKFLAQMLIDFRDGSRQFIVSDESWQTAYGPFLESDLLMGESYDARLEFPGWDSPGFANKGWSPVSVFPDPSGKLVATNGPTIKRIQELTPSRDPIKVSRWPLPSYIFDLGQNMVGRIRLRVQGPAGTTITLRYAEILNPNGTLYTENLRSARQTDYYTLRGEGEEVFEPRFTFHGFRYLEVIGYPGVPSKDTITGVVLHSAMNQTGEFECSDPLINQLQRNIVWGQKGNYLDVPTDCPQRDERLGWTGDAQVFIRTATFNYDVAAFFTKWQQDLADAQQPTGAIPSFAPDTQATFIMDGGPAWADAEIICPWTIYLCYGDKRLLETHYDSMRNFIGFLAKTSPGFIRVNKDLSQKDKSTWTWEGYGDWLAQDGSGVVFGGTPKDLIGTAFFAYVVSLMTQIAKVLNKPADAEEYERLYAEVRQAFIQRYVTHDGLVIGQTQTAYVLALHFGLLPEAIKPKVVDALINDINNRNIHLSTGFVGTPYLPQVLTGEGHVDTAYQLLLQKSWPSWLYSVTQGATTIWERWDGWTQENGFQDPGMNSFNHYAYGSIGAWMYAVIAGIEADPLQPGFKHFFLRPRPGGGLSYARGFFDSINGRIESSWRIENSILSWDVVVPANTTATAFVPTSDNSIVQEDGQPAEGADGVTFITRESGSSAFELESGRYRFTVEPF